MAYGFIVGILAKRQPHFLNLTLLHSLRGRHMSVRFKPFSKQLGNSLLGQFCLALWLCLSCEISCAEPVKVLGVSFPVDSLVRVDPFTIRVQVLSEERLTSVDTLESTVVSLTFASSKGAERISLDNLQNFIEAAVEQQQGPYAIQALPFYLAHPQLDVLEAADFLAGISGSATAVEAFKAGLTSMRINSESLSVIEQRARLIVIMLMAIGQSDSRWVRANALRWVFAFNEEFQKYVAESFSMAALHDNRLELARLVSVVKEILGSDDEFFQQISILRGRLEQVMGARESGEIEQLYPLVEITRKDPLSAKVLFPILSQRLHDEAARALDSGAFDKALIVLSRGDIDRRTPKTHELVKKALISAVPSRFLIFRDSQVDAMLYKMAQLDPEIKNLYIDFLERQADFLFSAGDHAQSELVLERMLRVRPDPSKANDNIRIAQARLYLRADLRPLAIQKLSQVRTGLSLLTRFRLGLSGLYFNRYLALLFLFVPLILVTWYLWTEVRRINRERMADNNVAGKVDRSSLHDTSEGSWSKKLFTKGALNREEDPREREYALCLKELGLEPTATLRQIKTSYRLLVKDIHPDVVKDEHGKASSKFIELTRAYDRALDLRRQLVIDDG